MDRGYLVAFCGMDGCGKSRMIRELSNENFWGEKFTLLRHPPDEWFENPKIMAAYLDGEGEPISDTEEVEFVAQLREQKQPEILKKIENGENVIFHRYIFSLFTYYAGSMTLDQEWIRSKMDELVLPDTVIYLRLSEKEFYRRNAVRFTFQNDRDTIRRIIKCYDDLAAQYNWVVIDADVDDVPGKVEKCKAAIRNLDLTKKLETFGSIKNKQNGGNENEKV